MRSFSKKLAFALAAAMVLTTAAPAAQAKAADEMTLNKSSQILYLNEGLNHKGAVTLPEGLNGNVSTYDFSVKNKPENWKSDYKFTWASSDEKVVTVKAGGLTTATGVGSATVSCVVTEKATGDIAATAKATVTVKANAAAVALVSTDVDGTVVEAGQTVDLDRVMFDENGNETKKRGTWVTDYTRWVALYDGEDAVGVTITQKNGKFTFTEDAPAGDYTLFCETYQSNKYNQTTATSDKVVVTLEDSSFEVAQKTVNTFDIKFDAAVKALGTVEVTRLVEANGETYEYPMVVKSATLAKDGKSAAVVLFSNLQDKVNYVVKVTGYDPYTLTASAGAPATMTLSAKADSISPFVTAGTPATIEYRLYDAKGVDVTTGKETILFNVKEYSTDGSYYVAGNQIWFAKAGLSTTVVAEYQSGNFVDGQQVGNVPATFDFVSVDKAPVTLKGVASATLYNAKDEDTKSLSFPQGDFAKLAVKIALSEGDPTEVKANDTAIQGVGSITFETVTPEIAALDLNTMQVIAFNQGTATIIVNLVTLDAQSNPVTTPIGVVYVTVQAKRALSNVTVDKALVTVGDATNFSTATIGLAAKDQYGVDVTINSVAFDGANDAAKAAISAGGVWFDEGKINVDGQVLANALTNGANAVQLSFTAKVNNDKTVTFAVLVKKAVDDANTNYIAIEAGGSFGEVARTADSKDAKAATFSVFKMNNGVKVGKQTIEAYPAPGVKAVAGNYYYKVTKNGNDVTQNVQLTDVNTVTINFSGYEENPVEVSGSALDVVSYDMGAGSYVFSLFKAMPTSGDPVLVQQQSANGVATVNPGSYSPAVRLEEKVLDADSDAALRACFSVKDTKGNEAATPYFTVDKDNSASGYVFVRSITFYEDVTGKDGVAAFAKYTVNVGVALKK